VGGPGTGKTHLATAIGVAGITRHGKRVRFYSTVDLVSGQSGAASLAFGQPPR
jgi:DNA replication protein DnaC